MHVCHLCDSSLEGHYFETIARGASRSGIRLTLVQLTSGEPPSWLGKYPGVRFLSLDANGKLAFIPAARG